VIVTSPKTKDAGRGPQFCDWPSAKEQIVRVRQAVASPPKRSGASDRPSMMGGTAAPARSSTVGAMSLFTPMTSRTVPGAIPGPRIQNGMRTSCS